jgi:hypothetical protein
MLSINGVPCHETGCPNAASRWDADAQLWVKQRTCDVCGYDCDADTECCVDEEAEPARLCIVDGCYGIHIPTRFAAKFRNNNAYAVLHVTPADWDELERGPDVEGYWDLWDEICRDAEIIDNETGAHYTLEPDGDLFMVQR